MIDQRKCDVVQVRMTGEYVGFSESDRFSAGVPVYFFTGVALGKKLTEISAVGAGLPAGVEQKAFFIQKLDGKANADVEGFQHLMKSFG